MPVAIELNDIEVDKAKRTPPVNLSDIERSLSLPTEPPRPIVTGQIEAVGPRFDFTSNLLTQEETASPPAQETASVGPDINPLAAAWNIINYPPPDSPRGLFNTRVQDLNARLAAAGRDIFNALHPANLQGYSDWIFGQTLKIAGQVIHPDTETGQSLLKMGDEYTSLADRNFKAAQETRWGGVSLDAPPVKESWQEINQLLADTSKAAFSLLAGGQVGAAAKFAGAGVATQAALSFGAFTAIEKPGEPEEIAKNMAAGYALAYGIDKTSPIFQKFWNQTKTSLRKAGIRVQEEANFLFRKAAGEDLVRASPAEKRKIISALRQSAHRNLEDMQAFLRASSQGVRHGAAIRGAEIEQNVPFAVRPGYYRIPEIGPKLAGINLDIRQTAKQVIEYQSRLARAWTLRIFIETGKLRKYVPNEKTAQDISFYIQKTGNPYIPGDTYADVIARLGPRQKVVARRLSTILERERQNVNSILKQYTEEDYIAFLENYLPQEWVGYGKSVNEWARTYARNSRNAMARKIPSYAEGIAAGFVPRTLDPIMLTQRWVAHNYGVAGNIQLYNTIKALEIPSADMKIPAVVNGQELAKLPKDLAGLYRKIESPIFSVPSRQIIVGGETKALIRGDMYAHPEVSKLLELITPYRYPRGGIGGALRAYDTFNAWAKGLSLRLSLFHHQALRESLQALLAKGNNPVRGLILSPSDAKALGLKWPISPGQAGVALMKKSPALVEEAIMNGLMLNTPVELGRGTFIRGLEGLEARTRGIPLARNVTKGIRQFNEWADRHLWDSLHKGGKLYAYYDIKSQLLSELPHIPAEHIGKITARMVNNGMGGLDWVNLGVSPSSQKMWQRILLAPDWTFSNLLVAADPLINIKDPAFAKIGAKYWRNMLASLFVWTEGLNIGLTGKSSFENEIGHRWDVDVTSIVQAIKKELGDVGNPNKRYYVSGFKQVKEVVRLLGGVGQGLTGNPEAIWKDYAGGKLSPAIQTITEQIMGYTTTVFPMPWKEYEDLGGPTIGPRIKALAEKFVPLSVRGNNFIFTFPLREGMSFYKAKTAFAQIAKADTDDSLFAKAKKEIWYKDSIHKTVDDIIQAASANGVNWQSAMNAGRAELVQSYRNKAYEYIVLSDEAAKKGKKQALASHDKQFVRYMVMSIRAAGFYNTDFDIDTALDNFYNSMSRKRKQDLGIPTE